MKKLTVNNLIMLLLPAFLCLFLVLPKQQFSENENRSLADFPDFTVEKLKNGGLMTELEQYSTDHFPLRDTFMALKTKAMELMGQRKINQVFLGRDGYLIDEYQKPMNTERITRILDGFRQSVEELSEQKEMHMMLVPTAVTIMQDKLPRYAEFAENAGISQLETAAKIYEGSQIPAIHCEDRLMQAAKEGQVYYRTDHHWTTFGAYQGYLAYCEAMNFIPVKLEMFKHQVVTDSFYGTTWSRVSGYGGKKDTIDIYENPADQLKVLYTDTGEVSDSLYNLDYINKKDKYSLFLNNLHPVIEISNTNSETNRQLMLIKDSYANSIVSFLTHHYAKIYVIDPRYQKTGICPIIEQNKDITDILILYNLNTMDTDLGIGGIY